MISASGVNALTAEPFECKLKEGNYLTAPPQLWLDGWKGDDGSVYQFVPTEAGEGLTVGEQLIESKDHSIQISVFQAKDPKALEKVYSPSQTWGDSEAGDLDYCDAVCSFSLDCAPSRGLECCSMGLGRGGKIKQKVYPDPYGIDVWKENPVKTVKIYLLRVDTEVPVTAEVYDGTWYGLKDEQHADIAGNGIFGELKSAVKKSS
jgi:hypothetical protein